MASDKRCLGTLRGFFECFAIVVQRFDHLVIAHHILIVRHVTGRVAEILLESDNRSEFCRTGERLFPVNKVTTIGMAACTMLLEDLLS